MRNKKKEIIRYSIVLCLTILLPLQTFAQWFKTYSDNIRSLSATLNNDWQLLPVIKMESNDIITISFDAMSHKYHRYTYRIIHCNADWERSDLYESDYIDGFNDIPIDDYENSINTTFEYTHYTFNIPNSDTSLKLSGNYLLMIMDEDENIVAEVKFAISEEYAKIGASVTSNTDRDINGRDQQLNMTINYSGIRVTDQTKEIIPYVMKNRNINNIVKVTRPTHRTNGQLEYSHCKDLIFEAGNEYRRFEIIDMYDYSQHVDRIDFHSPYYHATLMADRPHISYRFDYDHNGRYLIRNHDADNHNIEADYLFVHFTLTSGRFSGGDVYIRGDFTGNNISEEWKMEYNENSKSYTHTALLKQGAYDYQYVWIPDDGNGSVTAKTEGDCYETGNEYTILVYFRENGSRYDRLIGFSTCVSTSSPSSL